MKIKIYFHVAALPGWEKFVLEKTQLMRTHGLWEQANQVIFQLHYPGHNFDWIVKEFQSEKKVKFWFCPDSVDPVGETYSMIHLHNECLLETEPTAIFRYQTKGLSHQGQATEAISNGWVNYLDYWNIEQWRLAYHLLTQANYETVGCNWHPIWNSPVYGHYSGNIWWMNSSYAVRVRPLKKPHEIGLVSQLGGFSPRHDAELWISTGKPKYVTLHQYRDAVVYHLPPPDPVKYRLDMGC